MKIGITVSRTRQVIRFEPITISVELSDIEVQSQNKTNTTIENTIEQLTEKIDDEMQKYLDAIRATYAEESNDYEDSLTEAEAFEGGQNK